MVVSSGDYGGYSKRQFNPDVCQEGDVYKRQPEGYLDGQSQMIDTVNVQEVHNSFMASSTHLFSLVMNYRYRKEVTRGEKLIFFCQLASQYADELRFTDTYEISDEVEYPLICLLYTSLYT